MTKRHISTNDRFRLASVEITQRCNNRCPYCDQTRAERDMPVARVAYEAGHLRYAIRHQPVLDLPGDGLIGLVRTAATGERLAMLANLSCEPKSIEAAMVDAELRYDELAQQRLWNDDPIAMRPFQVRWLTAE